MAAFRRKKRKEADDIPKERHLVKQTFYVTGIQYHQEELMKLATPNPKWNKTSPVEDKWLKVDRYNFKNKPLVIDEDPAYPGSRRVMIDGLLVGYIKGEDVEEVKEILAGEVKYTSAYIRGGPQQTVCPNGEVFEDEPYITVRVSIGYVVEE